MADNYQGFTNAQTWCVWNTLNNTKTLQDKAVDAIRLGETNEQRETFLKGLAKYHRADVAKFAPWCWEYPNASTKWTYDVNWSEIRELLQQKIKEGV
jgi:hypothetical protein